MSSHSQPLADHITGFLMLNAHAVEFVDFLRPSMLHVV